MVDVKEVSEMTDEELQAVLDKMDEKAEKRRQYLKEHPSKSNWEATKKRIAEDPEFAAAWKEKRKKWTEGRWEKEKESRGYSSS